MTRTTLILQERRLGELKRLAAERNQTLSSLVDEFLADGIRRARAPKRRAPALPTFDMGEPRVNVADRDQLWEAMDRDTASVDEISDRH
jgi:hypothetical protein